MAVGTATRLVDGLRQADDMIKKTDVVRQNTAQTIKRLQEYIFKQLARGDFDKKPTEEKDGVKIDFREKKRCYTTRFNCRLRHYTKWCVIMDRPLARVPAAARHPSTASSCNKSPTTALLASITVPLDGATEGTDRPSTAGRDSRPPTMSIARHRRYDADDEYNSRSIDFQPRRRRRTGLTVDDAMNDCRKTEWWWQ